MSGLHVRTEGEIDMTRARNCVTWAVFLDVMARDGRGREGVFIPTLMRLTLIFELYYRHSMVLSFPSLPFPSLPFLVYPMMEIMHRCNQG